MAARGRAASLWARARDWWDPEPYREREDEWSGRRGAGSGAVGSGEGEGEGEGEAGHGKRREERWHAHTKQRRMARLEAAEAFELVGTMKAVVDISEGVERCEENNPNV